MPKAAFYAVKRGREPGIYTTWTECEAQTKGFSNPSFKKFNTLKEAEAFINPNDSTKSNSLSAARAPAVTDMSKPKTSSSSTPAVVKNEGDWVVVYTDGACHGNGREGSTAGIGVWWGPNDSRSVQLYSVDFQRLLTDY
ncbi:hypothetical protein FRC03_003183 [Tulasnella sp. 419]|nr:hypothetical protein FRC03_003183 [Tulasnella sp. 419]